MKQGHCLGICKSVLCFIKVLGGEGDMSSTHHFLSPSLRMVSPTTLLHPPYQNLSDHPLPLDQTVTCQPEISHYMLGGSKMVSLFHMSGTIHREDVCITYCDRQLFEGTFEGLKRWLVIIIWKKRKESATVDKGKNNNSIG